MRQMARSSQIWSRPCWAVGRRQPCSSCWKNSWRLKVAIVDPHGWMDRWRDLPKGGHRGSWDVHGADHTQGMNFSIQI